MQPGRIRLEIARAPVEIRREGNLDILSASCKKRWSSASGTVSRHGRRGTHLGQNTLACSHSVASDSDTERYCTRCHKFSVSRAQTRRIRRMFSGSGKMCLERFQSRTAGFQPQPDARKTPRSFPEKAIRPQSPTNRFRDFVRCCWPFQTSDAF